MESADDSTYSQNEKYSRHNCIRKKQTNKQLRDSPKTNDIYVGMADPCNWNVHDIVNYRQIQRLRQREVFKDKLQEFISPIFKQ
jgi:hypothetical protein